MNINIPKVTITALILVLLLCFSSNLFAAKPTHTDKATGMEFVLVPGGCFQMGNIEGGGSYTEYPVHEVCLDSYYIGKTEVTQKQWTEMMKENPSTIQLGDDYPVESISRTDISKFLEEMADEGDKAFRLPTEAE